GPPGRRGTASHHHRGRRGRPGHRGAGKAAARGRRAAGAGRVAVRSRSRRRRQLGRLGHRPRGRRGCRVKYLNSRRLGWDTETTGPNPLEDRIVTAAIVVRGGDRPDRVFSWLIDPKIPIPAEASEVHGVTHATVQADGQGPTTALAQIATHLCPPAACG